MELGLGVCFALNFMLSPNAGVLFCASQNGDTQNGVTAKGEEATLPSSPFFKYLYVALAGLVHKEICLSLAS